MIEADVADRSAVAVRAPGRRRRVPPGRDGRARAGHHRHAPSTSATTTSGPRSCSPSSRRCAFAGGSCSPAAWSSTARAATAATSTAPSRLRRRERCTRLRAGRFEPLCPHCRRPLSPEAVTEDAALDPRNVYAATKVHQEHLCFAFSRETGVPVTALRYHNVYGPRMPRDTPYAGVAAIFASAIAAGDPPRVHEDGGQLRDFVHVRDVARANVIALTEPEPIAGAFNVASGTPRSVGELARTMSDAAGPTRRAAGDDRRLPPRRRPARLRQRRARRHRARLRGSRGLFERHRGVRHRTAAERRMRRPALVVIAKAPVPGRVKTRLCPPCSPAQAAALAEAALLDTLEVVTGTPAGRKILVLDGNADRWRVPGFELIKQRGDGLGDRLAAAFDDIDGPALLVGMDTPQLSHELLIDGHRRTLVPRHRCRPRSSARRRLLEHRLQASGARCVRRCADECSTHRSGSARTAQTTRAAPPRATPAARRRHDR